MSQVTDTLGQYIAATFLKQPKRLLRADEALSISIWLAARRRDRPRAIPIACYLKSSNDCPLFALQAYFIQS